MPRIRVLGVEVAALRQVADLALAAPRGASRAPTRCRARAASSPSSTRSSVVLPEPFGPRIAANSPRPISMSTSLHTTLPPIRACASASSTAGAPRWRAGVRSALGALPRREPASRAHLPVACAARAGRLRSCATCHCSKVAEAGESVSVTVVIGMCARARELVDALHVRRGVLAVVDPDLDRVAVATWRSTVCLSAALTSVPSAIALAKLYGVSSFRPSVFAERLEDALAVAHRHAARSARGSARADGRTRASALRLERGAAAGRSTSRRAGSSRL